MCLLTTVLKEIMCNSFVEKFSRYMYHEGIYVTCFFLLYVLYSCIVMHTGSVLSSISNPSLRTLTTLLLSLYPAVSHAFICIVIMPVFLVTGQHPIVEGILEAQM